MQKYLIITADDFGLNEDVNEGVESAARNGVLTAASLMVAAPAAGDAVRRAAGLPNLHVGLHLVLADGIPALDSRQIPALTGRDGKMGDRMAYDGLRYFLLPRVRRQLEAEIRAQFAAFARTGLRLDHVNAHKHFHLHPTILEIALRVARDYDCPPVRATIEPLWFALRQGPAASVAAASLRPWASLMRRRLRRAGVPHNDSLFGIAASGAMQEDKVLQILAKLPPGVTEIYLHPARITGSGVASSELAALLSDRVRAAIVASGVRLGGFRDCLRPGAALI
jgi:hopanoid biosynthesis associated protein HpnK